MPDWPGYVVKMILEVTDDRRIGLPGSGCLTALLIFDDIDVGAGSGVPLAARGSFNGSILGESCTVVSMLVGGVRT